MAKQSRIQPRCSIRQLAVFMAALPILIHSVSRIPSEAKAAEPSYEASRSQQTGGTASKDPIARIREEGLNHSQLLRTLTHLTEVIGPRLTGSPEMKRANEWTRAEMASWGLTNAHLEAWGPFGRGWSLKRFSAQVIEPGAVPLIGYPKAWSPGFDSPLVAEVLYLGTNAEAGLHKLEGRLKGAIVLVSPVRELRARFEPLAVRLAETNLLRLANAAPRYTDEIRPRPRGSQLARTTVDASGGRSSAPIPPSTNSPATNRAPERPARGSMTTARLLARLAEQGAALVVSCSRAGDGGTLFTGDASLPEAASTNTAAGFRVWSTNCPPLLPQITLASEDYNRLVRMLEQGEKLKMAVELQVEFRQDDPMAYNTIAEIPGGDLKREIVMIGAHLDSVQVGTGATDDAAGVAVVMEAARIIKTLGLEPRRTIRVALWSGEEQGYLGSRAYVNAHFGYYTNRSAATSELRFPRELGNDSLARPAARTNARSSSNRQLIRQGEYDRLSCYFNLDNGTGKIRGVYMQGNEAVRPLFRRWLQPFRDLEAETLTSSNTGGTDHIPFDTIGLPGFQFIQDPIEYWSRTHHSNFDVFDRIQLDDLKQAATILAAFTYQAAMLDDKLPRKPLSENPSTR